MPKPRKPTPYTVSARLYDLISFEWPVYRAGRTAAIDLLALPPGSRVLDIGCGTGLNFPLLQKQVGPSGSIVGIDASTHMLEQARRRCDRAGWSNVELIAADATALDPADLHDPVMSGEANGPFDANVPFDAAIATYALSLMQAWPSALEAMIASTRVGGAIAVVDMQEPTGRAAPWTPLARLACRLGGADIDAHPWTLLTERADELRSASARGGHIQVRVGSVLGGSRP